MLLEPMAVLATSVTQFQNNLAGFDRVLDLLAELHRSGRTIVLITHDADVATEAERVMRIRDGEIIEGDLADSAAGLP